MESVRLTPFQQRTLEALLSAYPKGLLHEKLYPIMFPAGRFNQDKDWGSSKGGPSRVQCAVNWHMGRLGDLVRRQTHREGFGWGITANGRVALQRASGVPQP